MEDFKNVFCVMLLIIIIACVLTLLGFNVGYKQCAADFYEGKVDVELVEYKNGERRWEWIKK